jgi:hypothetical protein
MTARPPDTRAVARRSLDDLTPHPELLSLLGEPADEQVERLARALRPGQQPGLLLEVTPDGRVLSGHAAAPPAGGRPQGPASGRHGRPAPRRPAGRLVPCAPTRRDPRPVWSEARSVAGPYMPVTVPVPS